MVTYVSLLPLNCHTHSHFPLWGLNIQSWSSAHTSPPHLAPTLPRSWGVPCLLIDQLVTDFTGQEDVWMQPQGLLVQQVSQGAIEIPETEVSTEGHQGLRRVGCHAGRRQVTTLGQGPTRATRNSQHSQDHWQSHSLGRREGEKKPNELQIRACVYSLCGEREAPSTTLK